MNYKFPLYSALSSIPVLKKSYIGKIMLVAFIGIHTPLLCIITFLITQSSLDSASAFRILIVTLIATLAGTAATLYILLGLLKPVSITSLALRNYLKDHSLPNLPSNFEDEVGRLMYDVQFTVGELQETIKQLEKLSSTDSLTGASNRMSAETKLQFISANLGDDDAIYIAMIDLDKFKNINDEYGHQAGDLCLQHLVLMINQNIRKDDALVRWGGDEFLLMLSNSNIDIAKKTYQRLVDKIFETPVILSCGTAINLKASIGVVQCQKGFNVDECIGRADAMLYKAKKEGGLRVLFSF